MFLRKYFIRSTIIFSPCYTPVGGGCRVLRQWVEVVGSEGHGGEGGGGSPGQGEGGQPLLWRLLTSLLLHLSLGLEVSLLIDGAGHQLQRGEISTKTHGFIASKKA